MLLLVPAIIISETNLLSLIGQTDHDCGFAVVGAVGGEAR